VVHTTQKGAPLTGSVLQEGVLVLRKSVMKENPTSHLVQLVYVAVKVFWNGTVRQCTEKLPADAESFFKFREQFQLLIKNVGLFVDSLTVLTKRP
jgi:hypothetical protein